MNNSLRKSIDQLNKLMEKGDLHELTFKYYFEIYVPNELGDFVEFLNSCDENSNNLSTIFDYINSRSHKITLWDFLFLYASPFSSDDIEEQPLLIKKGFKSFYRDDSIWSPVNNNLNQYYKFAYGYTQKSYFNGIGNHLNYETGHIVSFDWLITYFLVYKYSTFSETWCKLYHFEFGYHPESNPLNYSSIWEALIDVLYEEQVKFLEHISTYVAKTSDKSSIR